MLFDERNYRINKVLLSWIGQWPYQTSRRNSAIILIIVFLAGTQIVAKICGLFSIKDMDVFIDSLSPLVADLGCGIKFLTCVLKTTQIKALFNQIRDDRQTLSTCENINIFDSYARKGRKFTIIYGGFLYFALILFMLVPLQPLLLGSSNDTTRPLLHEVNYYIDMDKYYLPILLHGYITAAICVTIAVATDTMFVIMVQHVCGLFTIIGQQVDNIIKEENLMIDINPPVENDEPYKNIIKSIHAHKRALRFANLVEAVFNPMLLVMAACNVLVVSMTGVTAMTNLDKPSEFLRQMAFSCALLMHLFFESFQAQQLIDHSIHIHTSLINMTWYRTSFKTRKIFIFMLMRTREPCVLTAGKMFVISMDTFSTIARMSMSYFTMLRSMQ
ncbi:odorant receptor 13a-like [Odontomachus brunneus]|uniref:odorant receptor 13a-like n=1 Tax=Odontomachus brunneus TaxID=486640 RepID=UPI0013F1820C|nr:odorant receptor 13a-like [Odontomachus brunneus]